VTTYSRNVFIPVTRLCRDRCHYCTFVRTPRQAEPLYLEVDDVLDIARRGAVMGCTEALFTLGDRPEERWPEAQAWLRARGYDSTIDYVRALAVRVLEETGLLPHLNPGVMSWSELHRLRPVSASMGMMLETTSKRLFETRGACHFGSPDKDPDVRMRVLEDAGRLAIPFTTGLLVGIGETMAERAESILALRKVSRQYRNVQEVIVQNFRAKDATAMRVHPDLGIDEYVAAIATTRVVLGPSVRIQAPPNLSSQEDFARLVSAGIDDWGGISPVTPDHVNPQHPWPQLDELERRCRQAGIGLRERLAVHPEYVRAEQWVDSRIRAHVDALASDIGFVRAGVQPVGLPWQEPESALHERGRTGLHAEIDHEGRRSQRRGDFAEVYGDWDELASTIDRGRGQAPAGTRDSMRPEFVAALARAAEGHRPDVAETTTLLEATEGAELEALARLADEIRRASVGDDLTFVVTRNINFTNVCYVGCRFCAFAQRKSDVDAYSLSLRQVADRAQEAWEVGATEVCVQGGIHPDMPGTGYFDLARTIKSTAPRIHLHAFSPMEVVNGAGRANLSIRDWLIAAREAGVDSIPGTAAEILDDEVRWVLTKGKLPAASWIEVISTAHDLGIPTTSTMMYGHVDEPHHWAAHLNLLAQIQREHGGFTEFVPLPFVHTNSPIYLAGIARPGPSQRDNRAVHAVARVVLNGLIDNIQASWVKMPSDTIQQLLRGGVNDLGGTLMEETISRMAGSEEGSAKSISQFAEIAQRAGRALRQRDTVYAHPDRGRVRTAQQSDGVLSRTQLPLVRG
jgi:FO synthase